MLNIINTDENEVTPELDDTKINTIINFRDKLRDRGTICKADVLALEEFVGYNVVTMHINANKCSNLRTQTMVKRILAGVDNLIETLPDTTITLKDTLELFHIIIHKIKEVIHIIERITNYDIVKYNKIIDPYYSMKWRDKEIIDLAKINVTNVILQERVFLGEIIRSDYLNELVECINEHHVFTLINILLSDNIANICYTPKLDIIEEVSFKSLIDTIFKSNIVNDLESLCRNIIHDKNDLINYGGEYSQLVKTNKRLTMLRNLIDNESITLLRAIKSIASEN